MTARVVVIGAGSAGCAVAGTLAVDRSRSVTLLEAGPASSDPAAYGQSFLDALASPGRIWAGLEVERAPGLPPSVYERGRGRGGSSAVNAMLAVVPDRCDHDDWVRRGAAGWGWADMAARYRSTRLALDRCRAEELGPISCAVIADRRVGAAPALLTRDATGRRVNSADAYLGDDLGGGRVELVGDALVDRVLMRSGRAIGVALADGRSVPADEVVVSCGAIHTPAVLLRSGIDRSGIGRGLQDHPAMAVPVRYRAGLAPDPHSLPIGAYATWSSGEEQADLQLLPVDHIGDQAPGIGVLMVALMHVHSQGSVTLRSIDPTVDPIVRMNLLSDERDRRRLRAGARRLVDLLAGGLLDAVGQVDPPDPTDDGIRAALGDYVHAAATCRMGRRDDPGAVVDPSGRVIGYEGLWVADTSILPTVPRANTHLIAVVIGQRIAESMIGRDVPIDGRGR
mgnify:CR=1 FL=1